MDDYLKQQAAASGPEQPFWVSNPIPSYTVRTDKLEEVYKIFFPTDKKKTNQVPVAIVGPAGIGKSEFAKKFGEVYFNQFDQEVVHINAETVQEIENSFRELAAKIGVKRTELPMREQIRYRMTSVYEHFGKRRSLFIFDNVDAWSDDENGIKCYLPQRLSSASIGPCVLMTSRNRLNWPQNVVKQVKLEAFTEAEAVDLIQARLNTKNDELALELAKLLGCLPLTLQLAVSYIKQEIESNISQKPKEEINAEFIKSYINTFHAEAKKLGCEESTLDDEIDKKALLACRIALNSLEHTIPGAVDMFTNMAFIAPDNIHLIMFESQIGCDMKDEMDKLHQFGLISKNSVNSHIVSVPRLLQCIVRFDNRKRVITILEEMFDCMNSILGELPDNITPYTTSCVIHGQQVWKHALDYPILLRQFEKCARDLHDAAARHEMHQANLSLNKQTLSKYKEHGMYSSWDPPFIALQHLVGRSMLELDEYEDAKLLHQSLAEKAIGELGDFHPLTCTILGSLACAEDRLGNYSEAIAVYNKVITALMAHPNFGPNSTQTLTTCYNKAKCLECTGKHVEALELFTSILQIQEQHHPEDRRAILLTKCRIADLKQKKEDYQSALQIYKGLHAEQLTIFGESHPVTLRCARGIGDCLRELGNFDDAMEIFNSILDLANGNPGAGVEFAQIRYSIAQVLFLKGEYEYATSQLRVVLDEYLALCGETHRDVLTMREQLGYALLEVNSTEEALEHLQIVFENRLRIFGDSHPDTIKVKESIEEERMEQV